MADIISTRSSMRNQDEQQEEEFEEEEEAISKKAKSHGRKMKSLNRGAWTAEEDKKLAQVIEIHGPRRWKSVASKAGLNRCGKSCRLRWMNYLRPNIKRGNISDQEEDLILRLHKLLGNRWSLIAGRLPGRTDNEIKNYWNSYLSKKIKQRNLQENSNSTEKPDQRGQKRKREFNKEVKECNENEIREEMTENCKSKNQAENSKESSSGGGGGEIEFNVDEFFDFSNENPSNLEWLSRFLQPDGKISCQFS